MKADVFHQRHLLAHRDGSMDRLRRQNRRRQRLVICESTVRDGVTLVERLAAGLAADAARLMKP